MDELFLRLKQARQSARLSQGQLAAISGVSLATIQNIEAGRANPAWVTLSALLKSLHLQVTFQSDLIEDLVTFGCPMMAVGPRTTIPSRQRLIETLRSLKMKHLRGCKRETGAIHAWLCAIRDHYPSMWSEASPEIKKWTSLHGPPRLKQRRLALAKLGEFL
jgi:transcriptional regulator with XRE-family HTH domain